MAPSIVRIIGLANGTNSPFIRPFDFGKDIEAFLNGDGNLEFAYDLPEDVTRIARVSSYFDGLAIEPFASHIRVAPRNTTEHNTSSHSFELPASNSEQIRHIIVLRPDDRVSVRLSDNTIQCLDFDIGHEEIQVKSSNRPRATAAQSTPALAMTASDLVVKDTPTVNRILKRTETSLSVPLDAAQESALPEIAEYSPMRDNSANTAHDRMDIDERTSDSGDATPKAAASNQTQYNRLLAKEGALRTAETLMSSAEAADDVYATPMDAPAIDGTIGQDETESESEKESDTGAVPQQDMSLDEDEEENRDDDDVPPLATTKKQPAKRATAKEKSKAEPSLSTSTSKKRVASAPPDENTLNKPKRSRRGKATKISQDSREDTIAVHSSRAASRAQPKPQPSSEAEESDDDFVSVKPQMPLTRTAPRSATPQSNRKKSNVPVVIEKATSNISERSTPSASTPMDTLVKYHVAKPVIAFSGSSMSTMSEVTKFLRSQGASVVDNVTSETTLLLVGK
ncbi:hypothetical protein LTS18_007039, partial [Coniosporium uncinatum]